MSHTRRSLVVPILVIVLGVGSLLNVYQLQPGFNWIWTLGLLVVGILTLTLGGVNKLTVVIGPFLIVAAGCAFLRQTACLSIEKEIPILILVLGCLMLLVQILDLRMPRLPTPPNSDKPERPH